MKAACFAGGLLFIILRPSNTNSHFLHILLVGYTNYLKESIEWRDFACQKVE